MITKENLREVLKLLNYKEVNDTFKKDFKHGASIEVDFNAQKITYAPLDETFGEGVFPAREKPANGFVIHRSTTLDFMHNENFVCLVCVHRLLEKGYEPKHILFEPAFKVGHNNKPSYGDILVFDKEYKPLVLIENKTYGNEFSKEWNLMQKDGGQLFSYLGPLVNQLGICDNLVLYAADLDEKSIIYKNHIITLKDNEKRIKELNTKKSFEQAQGKYFEVWNETYGKSFETKGLFEPDISSYSIGKMKYTTRDLKALSHAEIKPIFHEFATILRNHAITDFEHSFYILIDLFLCKITDEKNYPDDLQFYYKGVTRDTPKEYCSRLLRLYQLGKKQLFDIDIVNKEESDIIQIFYDTDRSVTNGLYAGIKELFEEIKFYNIKKFNFIEVENKEEFEMNFQILIKMAALIQDINLSNSETNHFFGDLFEGLLSKNVHQTEGQYFTPLPIVNFIINSLPKFPSNEKIKVLDYACGAGHFLTEFLKYYPNSKIYGIEKSRTLSQVAKIATIINGGKDACVIYKDALSIIDTKIASYQGYDKDSFDCIIANPPYSVDGFLDTINKEDRDQYSLTKFVDPKSYQTHDSIECFFLERADFFLKQHGLLGVVLPVSVLTNGSIYLKTRNILFNRFNILGIVSLNKRTFGSTGTSTIILFAEKVKKNAKGLIDTFLSKKDFTQYLSHNAIFEYIKKQKYNKADYIKFMQDRVIGASLETNEVFQDYRDNFKASPIPTSIVKEWFKHSSTYIKSLKESSKEYRSLLQKYIESPEYNKKESIEIEKQFIDYSREIEIDKLTTYIQVYSNKVALLQSPPEKLENKSNKDAVVDFLGYYWSNKRGNEGIKYITGTQTEENEDEDTDILETINSIKNIKTPLYNPNDDFDNSKFSYALRKHMTTLCQKFSSSQKSDTFRASFKNELSNLFCVEDLSNLIDFSLATFDKKIRTKPVEQIQIKSKFKIVKLAKIAKNWTKGQALQKDDINEKGKHPCIHYGELFTTYDAVIEQVVSKTNVNPKRKSEIGDILFPASDVTTDGLARCSVILEENILLGSDIIVLRPCKKYEDIELNCEYLSFAINQQREQLLMATTGANVKHSSSTLLKNIKIPLPPSQIQSKIVKDCKTQLEEYRKTRMENDVYRNKITEIFKKYNVIIE